MKQRSFLPKILEPFAKHAERLASQGCVQEIEFSGPTYQVCVQESADTERYWAFLQLDEQGGVRDCFCECDESDKKGACRHIAAGYLRIYDGHSAPLHQRFLQSIWYLLSLHYAEKVGYDTDQLVGADQKGYEYKSISGKVLFSIEGGSEEVCEHLYTIMEARNRETEETSLKFSNLPQGELQLWREGRPSPNLLFQLSGWYDLAKWLMQLQESGDYSITFGYSSTGLPNALKATFRDVVVYYYIPEVLLIEMIPALAQVKSAIPVHDHARESIESMTYDPDGGSIQVHRLPGKHLAKSVETDGEKERSWALGDWTYSPSIGFVRTAAKSLSVKDTITGDAITDLLRDHYPLLREFLKGVELNAEPLDVSYRLTFDDKWNLHVGAYLFEPGDLQEPQSRLYGKWVYLEGHGFQRVRYPRSEKADEVVPFREVSDFVTRNRVWLNSMDGFSTHVASMDAEMTYTVDLQRGLHFHSMMGKHDAAAGQVDFGRWVYLAGKGFYSKVAGHFGMLVRPGNTVPTNVVASFIDMHTDELQLIPNFFSHVCPIIQAVLDVQIEADQSITITPRYEYLQGYQDRKIAFFGDYVYVTDEGFHHLPAEARLPEEYRSRRKIAPKDQLKFLTHDLPSLLSMVSYLDPRLKKPEKMRLMIQDAKAAKDRGLYWLNMYYEGQEGQVSLVELWAGMNKKQRFLFSSIGLIDLHDPRFSWLHALTPSQIDEKNNRLELTTMELIRLNVLDEVVVTDAAGDQQDKTRTLMNELYTFSDPQPPDLNGLCCELRPYQVTGVNWLWFLYQHGLSGILCDDMGLGKTHQAMALMAAIANDLRILDPGRSAKFLVVCPTSVIFHWEEKLKEFLPGLRVHTFYGVERRIEDFGAGENILLTSYGVWRREAHRLRELPFDLVAFDEVQAAKSHGTRLHKALLQTRASMRLGLTGTPIENHLMELKALFDLILPAYMPGEREFREFFLKPIEKGQDLSRRHLLSRLVKPFMLRRKKDDVLTDLPEKTEEIFHCELSVEQVHLYNQTLAQSRRRVLDELKDSSRDVPYVHIFAILTQLKRICNHPAVFLNVPKEYREHHSGKWDLFVELLSEARASGQKVVVFTQYLAMLDIFIEYLTQENIEYASIRGATINRGEQLRRFNQDPDCEVFLGSLQAVGFGVDLTAASVVIHYDRWWNAARENQATDRVHRIGQTRGVQVFKLVTKNTFEERIDALITSKGKLLEEVVGVDDHEVIKRLDRDELVALLQTLDVPTHPHRDIPDQ